MRAAAAGALALLLTIAGCDQGGGSGDDLGPAVVDGERVDADTLRKGRFLYMRWCAGCHGPDGRGGGGRARTAKRPPPDLTKRAWRHAEAHQGELPSDAHLRRVVREGIDGTIMTPMPVPDDDLPALVTYVKYLASPGADQSVQ
ncbi:MAG: c-type cytochrome [Myxococcota bacterium]